MALKNSLILLFFYSSCLEQNVIASQKNNEHDDINAVCSIMTSLIRKNSNRNLQENSSNGINPKDVASLKGPSVIAQPMEKTEKKVSIVEPTFHTKSRAISPRKKRNEYSHYMNPTESSARKVQPDETVKVNRDDRSAFLFQNTTAKYVGGVRDIFRT